VLSLIKFNLVVVYKICFVQKYFCFLTLNLQLWIITLFNHFSIIVIAFTLYSQFVKNVFLYTDRMAHWMYVFTKKFLQKFFSKISLYFTISS